MIDETAPNSDERRFLHDLSTPLSIVSGHLKLLQMHFQGDEKSPPMDQDKIQKSIETSVKHIDRIATMLSKRRTALKTHSSSEPS